MPPKRATYTVKFKLRVVNFAEESNNIFHCSNYYFIFVLTPFDFLHPAIVIRKRDNLTTRAVAIVNAHYVEPRGGGCLYATCHKCHLPFIDSTVLLKQKRSKVMIAKPAKILIISFNNNTPLVESNPGKHPVKV